MSEKFDHRLRKVESNVSSIVTEMINMKQILDSHETKCPFSEYKNDFEKEKNNIKDEFNKIEEKEKWTIGIAITILILLFGNIFSLQLSKVSIDSFDKAMENTRQEQIRRDERIQILYENQNSMQKELMTQISELKVVISSLSTIIGNKK